MESNMRNLLFISVLFLMAVIPVSATVFVDLQAGLTQFYMGDYYGTAVNERGYRGDLNTTMPMGNWDVALDIRALGFPGRYSTLAYYTDIVAKFYVSDSSVKPFIGPVLGYSHTRVKALNEWADPVQYDFYRFGGVFGIASNFGDKYLNFRFGLIAETPTWKEDDHYYSFPEDFYLEQSIEAEFGWSISDHFGMTAKLGALKNNFVSNSLPLETLLFTGGYIPSIQVGPSIYF